MEIVPIKGKLRACYLCGLVKTSQQFKKNGCENCEEVLNLRNTELRINDCTSANFDNTIALLQPGRSWVAKWQREDKFVAGLYAMRVSGQLPEQVVDMLAERGIDYRPRDGTAVD